MRGGIKQEPVVLVLIVLISASINFPKTEYVVAGAPTANEANCGSWERRK
jgi:hypothetical protein